MSVLIEHLFVEIEILLDVPPRKLVQVAARRAAVAANQPEEQLTRLLALQQTHRGREIRRPSIWMPKVIGCVNRLNRIGGIGVESSPHCGGLQRDISMSWSCERFSREWHGVSGIRKILGLAGSCSWIRPSSWLPSPKAGLARDGWAQSSRGSTRWQ